MVQSQKSPLENKDEVKKIVSEKINESVDDFGDLELGENSEIKEFENLSQEQIQNKQIRINLEKANLDDSKNLEAQLQAGDAKNLDEQKKITKLLDLAKTKGVVFAVSVAKKMDDPYLLDVFHDTLVKGGHYKEFLK